MSTSLFVCVGLCVTVCLSVREDIFVSTRAIFIIFSERELTFTFAIVRYRRSFCLSVCL